MMLSMGERRISSKEVKPELSAEIVIHFPEEIIIHFPEEIIIHFPEEIIEAILLRLPVRSLLILKCVCKSWYSLISSNYFIQAHLRFSKEHTNFDSWRVVFQDVSKSAVGEWPSAIKHCSFLPLPSGAAAEAEAVGCGIPMESSGFAKIVGVCNGLICVLVYNQYICLCNPSTREIKKLPDLAERGLNGDMFGFGFDEASEDYKVVYTRYPLSRVYSLKSNSWKQTETLKDFVTEYDVYHGVFVSQRLHWSRRLGNKNNNRYEIASFDLANEIWEKTVIPDFYGQGFGYCVLFGFGGYLSVLCKSPEQEVDVWVLKEYGNRQSWRKLLHIPQFKTHMVLLDRDGPNGDTIVLLDSMCTDTDLITYDLKDNSSQLVRFRRKNTDSVYQEQIFIESLVPLTSRHQEGIKPEQRRHLEGIKPEFNCHPLQYAFSLRKLKFIVFALLVLLFFIFVSSYIPPPLV